jgi:hypothetical protein
VINDTIIQFYKNLFNEIVHWHPKLDGLEFPLLDSFAEANWLERPLQEEEVLQALLSMDGDKALSLEGFAIVFFRSVWAYSEG